MTKQTSNKFSPEVRERAVRMVFDHQTERLAEAGIEPSVGSVGDSYDNALAETVILFKTEVIHRRGPWRCAPGSWQRIGGGSPPRGRSSQPPRPRVMHEALPARAAVKRSQGRPRAKY